MNISFLGDVYLDQVYKVDLKLNNIIFNLEYPLSTEGIPARYKINLGVDTPNIKETFGQFPLAVNLANNHIMDYGEDSFNKTMEYLEKNNIKKFGAGKNKNNYNNPCFLNLGNKKIALLGYSCKSTNAVFGDEYNNGSAILEIEKIIIDIKNSKKESDMVIISLHWGDEEIKYPKFTDVQIAHKIIDAGADLIIGHHAHVIQTIEQYHGKYIFYGIGNFIFSDFDLPSYYDGSKFQNRSSKIQQKQNKETIIVHIDENLDVNYETAIFKDGIVISKKVDIPTWLPKTQKQYNLYVTYIKRVGTIKRFLKQPKLPTIMQFKIFLGIKHG